MVYDKLNLLIDPKYKHRYMVDGPITTGDAYFNNGSGSRWRTVLVAGLRAGGQGIYALDVTDPSKFSEASNVTNTVLWEFTDPDLGYTFSQPDIIRLNDGTWAVIFGSGYNNTEADGSASTTGHAYLFVVNIANGKLIRKIDTGSLSGTVTTSNPNGLSTATPVDTGEDNNQDTDYVYAGDLMGNMWRFDIRDSSPSNWTATKLFTTLSPSTASKSAVGGLPQPITTRPSVAYHPDPQKNGVLVYFGTGSYIDVNDAAINNQETQTFYAVWDDWLNAPPTFTRNSNDSSDYYLQQVITDEKTLQFPTRDVDIRFSTDYDIKWAPNNATTARDRHHGWYIDLYLSGSNSNKGERQIFNSVVRGDRIIFNTTLPDTALCSFGGDSWLMELDFANGGRLTDPPLDVDGDGVIDGNDLVLLNGVNSVISGMKFDGIMTDITIIAGGTPGSNETKIANTSAGVTVSVQEKAPGGRNGSRGSWTEITP
jgi:type IV pilus assembly protein PilY1